jgi:hypothetical protein
MVNAQATFRYPGNCMDSVPQRTDRTGRDGTGQDRTGQDTMQSKSSVSIKSFSTFPAAFLTCYPQPQPTTLPRIDNELTTYNAVRYESDHSFTIQQV